MSANSAITKLDALGKRLEAIEHAQSMLGVDEAVMMPVGGGEKRAEAMGTLAALYHQMATAPEIGDWISAAEDEPLEGYIRVYVDDPFGNRIELMERKHPPPPP